MYCFMKTGLPSVACTSSVCNLVLATSVEDLEMILLNLDSSIFNTLIFHLSASVESRSLVSGHSWLPFPCCCLLDNLEVVSLVPLSCHNTSAWLVCNFSVSQVAGVLLHLSF